MGERRYHFALLLLGHGVFLALLVLAWKYALIRSTFGDTAFQEFQWISQPGWDIEAHRYTAIVPQACVKFFALFGPDLRSLLFVASLAHVLVGYGIFVLCAHVWRAPTAAFACALAAVLCSRLAFYSPVLEANYLLCYPFLLVGFMERNAVLERLSTCKIAFACALLLVPLIVHPVGWMVMLFCVVFMFSVGWLRWRAMVPLVGLSVLWPLIARWIFPPTGYEIGQYEEVAKGFDQLASFTSWGSWDFLSIHTFSASTTYLPAWLVLVAVVLGWVLLKDRRAALLTLAGAVGFLSVFLITFHAGNSAVMQDRGVLPVATIIALSASALAFRVSSSRLRPIIVTAAALVLFMKSRDVSFASRPFAREYAVSEELIAMADEQGISRGIVDCDAVRARDVGISWAFPVETLLRSAVRGPEMGRVLVCSDDLPAPEILASGQVQLLHFTWALDKKGDRYFQRVDLAYRTLVQH